MTDGDTAQLDYVVDIILKITFFAILSWVLLFKVLPWLKPS